MPRMSQVQDHARHAVAILIALLLSACSGARLESAAPAASGLGHAGPPPPEANAVDVPAERVPAEKVPVEKVPAEKAPAERGLADETTPAEPEEPAADDAEAPEPPAKEVPCPPLLVGGDDDEPLREPWVPHKPAYYQEDKKDACPPASEKPDGHDSRITDKYIRPEPGNVPTRPQTVLEIGDPFMSPGRISKGICLPTGQVIRPRLLMYGTYRSALQGFNRGRRTRTRSEWVNRLDLFFNLQLSATERVVLGFRPLNEGTKFSGFEFRPRERLIEGFNADITTLFFEGEFGEIFPKSSPRDFKPTDIGFSVGRQPIFTQGGIMINDDLDSFGLTRNSIRPSNTSNVLLSGLVAWNHIDRGFAAREDNGGYLFAVHGEIDTTPRFVELDVAGVNSGTRGFGDALFLGAGVSQRFGKFSSVLRANQSFALDGTTAATGTGTLLTSELSFSPKATDDNVYFNAFGALGQYDSAARRPESGGPLGGIGVQFASAGLGRAAAPINPRARDAVGGALGYQQFFCGGRSNLIFELAGRASLSGADTGIVSGAIQYQRALGGHFVFTCMGFAGWQSRLDDITAGGRLELLIKF